MKILNMHSPKKVNEVADLKFNIRGKAAPYTNSPTEYRTPAVQGTWEGQQDGFNPWVSLASSSPSAEPLLIWQMRKSSPKSQS